MLLLAAGLLIVAIWPRQWAVMGADPSIVLGFEFNTELEVQESLAKGYAEHIAANEARLEAFAALMKAAWLAFVGAPILATLIMIATSRAYQL